MTDLDGDGDLDLFSVWSGIRFESANLFASGWVMALNDGSGAFETARTEKEIGEGIENLRVGDLTGDGQDEIATYTYANTYEDWEVTVWVY